MFDLKQLKPGQNFYNVVYSISGKAFSAIALIALDVAEARMLGSSGYAEWAYFFSILNMCFFVGWAGINSSTKVIIAHCETTQEKSKCINAGLNIRILASIGVSLFVSIFMVVLSNRLGYPDKYPHLRLLFLLSFFLIICNSFADFYKNLFTGLNSFRNVFIITLCEYFFYLSFCLVFMMKGNSVISVAIGYIFAGILLMIVGISLIYHYYPIHEIVLKTELKSYKQAIIKRAIPMMVVGVGAVLLIELDTFMLGLLSDKTQVAVYNIAKNLTNKTCHINYSLVTGVMTSFAIIADSEREHKLRKLHAYSITNVILSIIIAVGIYLFSPLVINYMYGSEYVEAIGIFKLLIGFYVMNSISIFFAGFLDFRGKTYISSITYLFVVILDIAFNMLLIPRMGARGASIATEISMIPYLIVTIVFSLIEIKRIRRIGDEAHGKIRMEKTNL